MEELTPQLRVITALAPFAVAMILRLTFGRRGWTRWFVTLATMWFAMNVLLAPYSVGIRREVMGLRSVFR